MADFNHFKITFGLQVVLTGLSLLSMSAGAATVVFTDNADGTVTVAVTAEGALNIVALALDVEVTEGYVTGVSIDTPCFNIFPDSAFTQELWMPGSYTYGSGTPIAEKTAPGEIGLPAASFTVCAGCLNGSATPGADGAASVQLTLTFTLDAQVSFCISENGIRGGIVLTDGTAEDITNGTNGVVCGDSIICPPCECLSSSAPFYADWVAFGMPDCWCYRKNCLGDADGLLQGSAKTGYVAVYTADLGILSAAWNIKEPPQGPGISTVTNGICADFDRAAQGSAKTGYVRVYTGDLGILSTNWNIKEPPAGPGIGDCTSDYYIYFFAP